MKTFKRFVSRDEGSALALVLILITVLSTMLMSIAFLTQSASQTIAQQAQNKSFKSDIFTTAYQQAMECLTVQKNCPGGGNNLTFGSADNPCDVNNWYADLSATDYEYGMVKIQCSQPTDSGLTKPLASYMLVGSGCLSSCATPIVGFDGGLAITNGDSCKALKLNGGLLNVSGAWNGISSANCNFSFDTTDSKIITPNPAAPTVDSCPASGFGVSCSCPTGIIYGSNRCPSNYSYDSLNPSNTNSYISAYLKVIGSKVSSAYIAAGGISGAAAQINSCSINPGVIDNSTLNLLNNKTSNSNECGTFTFNSGTYIFAATTDPYGSETAAWIISDGVNVVSNGAVKIILANNSIIDVANGSLNLIAAQNTPSDSNLPLAPVIATGDSGNNQFTNVVWNGYRRPAITIGSSGTIATNGIIFSPSGAADIQNQAGAQFTNGVILSGLKLNQNSNSSANTVAAPPSYDGDRLVQLRFWFFVTKQDPAYDLLCHPGKSNFNLPYCSSAGIDVGVVQLQLLDYFGIRTGSGYSVKVWQAP